MVKRYSYPAIILCLIISLFCRVAAKAALGQNTLYEGFYFALRIEVLPEQKKSSRRRSANWKSWRMK